MISWLRETDGLEFIEAVRHDEIAGLPMPLDDRAPDASTKRRKAVVDVCDR